jgi:hypothetical protein
MQYSPSSCCFLPLGSRYSQHPVLKHHQSAFFPSCEWASFTPIKDKITVLYILMFTVHVLLLSWWIITKSILIYQLLPSLIHKYCPIWNTTRAYSYWLSSWTQFHKCKLIIQGDSKLLSGFPWPVIFKPEITK